MSESNHYEVPTQTKACSCCYSTKNIRDFIRCHGNNPQYEHATCNRCHEKRKNKKQKINPISRKRAKLNLNSEIQSSNPSSSSNLSSSSNSLPSSNPSSSNNLSSSNNSLPSSNPPSSSTNIFQIVNDLDFEQNNIEGQITNNLSEANSIVDTRNNRYDDDDSGFLYSLDEVEGYISKAFQDSKNNNEPVKLAFEIELDPRFAEFISCDLQSNALDLRAIKDNFRQLARVITVAIESGSHYYWEIRGVHLNFNKERFTGCATIYLGCTQREDRQWQRPENQPVMRKSEARAPVDRYACEGNISLVIDSQQCRILAQIRHQDAHPHPQHRKVQFPKEARAWIKENIVHNLRSHELYSRLCHEGHIDPQKHTKEQAYYWMSVFSKETYVMNSANQILSAKAYLEQPEFVTKGFKPIYYLENDFVRALGFATPLLNRICVENVNEIIVDSTFKTNQERFELFVINANCGGYGMPLAYLYVLTSDGTELARCDPKNKINTRVQALCEFFTSLRQMGVLPIFSLVDKDAGEISAIGEAWSWTTNIQLCYWHLEQAIERRLKDKKSRANAYTKPKAVEAHQQFAFIDPHWVPNGNAGVLCPEDSAKELLEIIKKHANMHPLIPIAKDVFWSSAEIYRNCVEEVYRFCHNRNLAKLWGYLWLNWYNKKDWKLFARSAYPVAIPLARTTMITESHWRVLKYNYKFNYNRPRLDRLTQIIVTQLIPDFEIKLNQFNSNRIFPPWWIGFKKEWDKATTVEIRPDMDETYHSDVHNWVCSCPAYLRSRYLLCKHLVAKKGGVHFRPTFAETRRRHDYPLFTFEKDEMPAINRVNNAWARPRMTIADDPINEGSSSIINSQSILEAATHGIMEERREKLSEYKKVMDTALALYERELDNSKFVDAFDSLMKPLVKEVDECKSALQAHSQQKTWKSNGKLAFWLR